MSDLSLALTIKVVDEATNELKAMNAEFSKIASGWEKLGFAIGASLKIGVGVAVGALATLTKAAIDSADQMGDASQRIGISTQSLSELAYAAKMSGSDLQTLESGLSNLNRQIVESQKSTSEAANAFKFLGVETKNADGSLKSTDAVFKAIAESIKKLPDGASKSAVSMQLLGKAGKDLVPLLNNGADGLRTFADEAAKLGIVISQDTADAAGEFNDTIDKFGVTVQGLGTTIAKDLLPTLKIVLDEFLKISGAGDGFKEFGSVVSNAFKVLVIGARAAIFALQTMGKYMGALFAAGSAALSGNFAQAATIAKEFAADSKQGAKDVTDFSTAVWNAVPAVKAETEAKTTATVQTKEYTKANTESTKAKQQEQKAFDNALYSLLKSGAGYKDLTSLQQINMQITEGSYKSFTAAHKKRLQELAAELDAERLRGKSLDQTYDTTKSFRDLFRESTKSYLVLTNQLETTQSSGSVAAQVTQDVSNALEIQTNIVNDLEEAKRRLIATDQTNAQGMSVNAKAIGEVQTQLDAATAVLDQFFAKAATGTTLSAKGTYTVGQEIKTWQQYFGEAIDKQKLLDVQAASVASWLEEGKITLEGFNHAVEQINAEKFKLVNNSLSEVERKVGDLAVAIQDTLGDQLYDVMQGNFDNIGDGFKKLIDRMVAQALAAKLSESIFGANFSKTGQVGGAGGAVLSSLFSAFGFRAEGGPVSANKPYIVGERGPEPFFPKTSGTIMSNSDMMSAMQGGGGNSLQLSITAMDSQSVIGALDKVKRQAAQLFNGTNRTYNLG